MNNATMGQVNVSKTRGMAQVALFAALIVLMALHHFWGTSLLDLPVQPLSTFR